MEFIKIKLAFAISFVVLLSSGYQTPKEGLSSKSETTALISTQAQSDISIVMEDDVMRVNTNDPNDQIVKIQVITAIGQMMLDIDGCYSSLCTIEKELLPNNQFLVKVFTSEGRYLERIINPS